MKDLTMPYDHQGHKIRARSRQYYATEKDLVDFMELVLENIPEAGLYREFELNDPRLSPISISEWLHSTDPFRTEVEVLFCDPNWNPVLGPYREEFPDWLIVTNWPSPSASMFGGGTFPQTIDEVGRTIRRAREGVIHSNNRVEDAWGKKTIDKLYRLSGKIFSNKCRWVDLVTGETVEELRYANWCGRNMARRCDEEEDLFLDLWINHENNRYCGLKPAR